jgi:hypothetical protein
MLDVEYDEKWQQFIGRIDVVFAEITECMRDIPSARYPARSQALVELLGAAGSRLTKACDDIVDVM